MERYCTRCGYAIDLDFVCCPDCGLRVDAMHSQAAPAADGSVDNPPRRAAASAPPDRGAGKHRDAAPTVVRRLDSKSDSTRERPKGAREIARIEVLTGQDRGASFELGDSTTIGRGSRENGIILNDDSVSRRHAVIEYADRRYVYTDAGSMNGSYVIGTTGRKKRIRADVPLQDGDQIELGSVRIAFRLARE